MDDSMHGNTNSYDKKLDSSTIHDNSNNSNNHDTSKEYHKSQLN